MTVIFDATTRKSISRRIVKIPIENDAYDTSKNGINEAGVIFSNVDLGNKLWFDEFNTNIVAQYNAERAAIDGTVYGSIVEQDLLNAANQTDYNIFFEKGEHFNPWMIPKINYMVNSSMENPFRSDGNASGQFQTWDKNGLLVTQYIAIQDDDSGPVTGVIQNITGASAPYTITVYQNGVALDLSGYTMDQNAKIIGITNLYSEYDRITSIDEIYDVLIAGFAGVGTGTGTYDYSAKTLTVNTNTWTTGQYVIGDDGASDGAVLVLTSGPSGGGPNYTYTVRDVATTGNDVTATWHASFGGFSNGERESLSGSSYDNALVALAEHMKDYVYLASDTWEDFLQSQQTALGLNQEDRAAKQTENSTALADVVNALTVITTWQGFPDTGATGKFSDGEIDTISAETAARLIFTGTRLTQIGTSLGGVVDNNDGTFTYLVADDDILYRNYKFMDFRINRVYGSLSRAIRQTNSSNILDTLINVNTDLNTIYTDAMAATLLTADADGSSIIEVDDPTLFSPNDNIYVISESQVELSGIVISIRDNKINLTVNVAEEYTVIDLARIYKVL